MSFIPLPHVVPAVLGEDHFLGLLEVVWANNGHFSIKS
jgi:hypothetical protein